jgi:hypothetical protein
VCAQLSGIELVAIWVHQMIAADRESFPLVVKDAAVAIKSKQPQRLTGRLTGTGLVETSRRSRNAAPTRNQLVGIAVED